ncbi:MAG: hypothetical protein AAGC56_13210 [Pseudomonadota bacterium]
MKAITLLLMRISTGLLLVIWGGIKVMAPTTAIAVSNKYYGGAISEAAFQTPLGAGQMLLGALVILGLLRRVVYPLQAIVLGAGLLAIWKYIADPLGLYLLTPETRQVLFFPSTTVFFAALAVMAFRSDDRLALDELFVR